MIGIKAIASYIPSTTVSNIDRIEEAGKDQAFIIEKVGFLDLTRKDAEDETSDLCVKAFELLLKKVDLNKEDVDCLVVCTQNPDGYGLPHTSAIVQHKLGLTDNVAAFDISLGCSGFVYSLDVTQAFMAAQELKCGLLFTADPYSKVIDKKDFGTELLFGDATCVTLIGEDPIFKSKKSTFCTSGKLSHSIAVNKDTRVLSMLGNNVFKFALKAVPPQMNRCLEKNDLTKDDIDLFLLHQGSKYIIDNLIEKLEVPAEKVPFQATNIGNSVSSTIPIMLEDYLDSDKNTIAMSGFGVGLSWATSILERVEK